MIDLATQLERIESKLKKLRVADSTFSLFAAKSHKYLLNKPLKESYLISFEKQNSIKLPAGYREFLMKLGNGGAGPYYGLEPLQNTLFADLDYQNGNDLIDASKAFPHQEKWNMNIEEYDPENEEVDTKKEDEYFDNKWIAGLLKISNYGCGVAIGLVVNGPEYNTIWIDDRCNDRGIFPEDFISNKERINFLDWYEAWLDQSLLQVQNSQVKSSNEEDREKRTLKKSDFLEAVRRIFRSKN